MKILKNKSLFLALAVILITSSCQKLKDFGDTNVDPNRTTSPSTSALLTNVLSGLSGIATQQNPGYFCQYFGETQYPGISIYTLPQFDFDGIYAGALYDLQNIIIQNSNADSKGGAAANGSNNNQIATARILKAYIFWTITDRWGDCPYSQALTITNKFPKYDKQQDIYIDLFKELKESIAQFDGGAPLKGDIIFNGDNAKWKKTANSLRMLIALRMSKKYPNAGQLSATEFAAALTDPSGSINTNADNLKVTYPGGNFRSPWFATYDSRDDLGESSFFGGLANSFSDKRQSGLVFSQTNDADKFVPNGRDRNYMTGWFPSRATTYAKVLGANLRQSSADVNIIHASMVLFARAEARERGWTSESTAQQLYNDAITASYTQWGLTVADASTYLSNPGVAYGSNNLTKIATQRYLALYPDGIQGWSEWRRTGIPVLPPAPDAANTSKAIPRRFVYGTNDYSTNVDNVKAAAQAIPSPGTPNAVGGDTQDGKVWWDQ
jgi:Starch-binding associating with outer membrane